MGFRDRFTISGANAALVGITLLAAGLRLGGIGEQSFWHDEALTVESAKAPFGHIIETIRNRENCPPAYFILINLWAKCFAISDASLRLPSALMGIATVWVIYRLGKVLFDQETIALTAAAMLAVSKYHIAYSQEARPYAMLMLLLALCVWAFVRMVKTGSPVAQVAYVLTAAAAMYTHTFALFVIAVCNAFYLWQLLAKRQTGVALRRWLMLQAAVILLFSPWIPTTREVMAMGLPWMRQPTPVLEAFLIYAGGFNALIVMVLLVVSALMTRDRWVWMLLALVVMPVVVPVMYGVFTPRFGIGALVGLVLLCASGAARAGPVGCVAAVIALMVLAKPPDVKADFRGVAAYLVTHGNGDDVRVNRTEGFTDRVIEYYLAGRGPRRVADVPAKPQAGVWVITDELRPPAGYQIVEIRRFTGVNLLLVEPVAGTRRSD